MNQVPSQHTLQTQTRTRALILATAAGLTLVTLLAYTLLARVRRAPRPQPGDPAPEFTLTTFDDKQIALQDLRGQIVVLYFWASWSAPSRREAPGMEKLWQDYFDIIAQRLRDELTAGAISDSQARRHVVQLAADGRWRELDYDDRARTHWSPCEHPARLARMAAAYRAHLYSPTEADELEQAILSALAFWVETDPQSDNWWYNSIHTPTVAQTAPIFPTKAPPSSP